jgi:phage N-6-adenine-methyltransferase
MTTAREALHSSASNNWHTPARYIDAARSVMGGIDLDPASCAEANERIGATRFYSEADNGLSLPWQGRIWLNPPYGRILDNRGKRKPGQQLFSQKLIAEYRTGRVDQAVLLVNACTGDQWFQPLFDFPICFPSHRIKFLNEQGGARNQPTHSSVFVYFGSNVAKFAQVFRQFGRIVRLEDVA